MTPDSHRPGIFPISIFEDTILHKGIYFIQKNRFAIHGPLPPALNLPILYQLEKEQITVLAGDPEKSKVYIDALTWTPVYGRDENDSPAVPTGLIFFQLEDGQEVETKRELLLKQGYLIQEILKYAPHCAWLISAQKDIAEALNNLQKLMRIPGVVNIKPQLLRPRSFK